MDAESNALRRWRQENLAACSFCGRRDYGGSMTNDATGATICDGCIVELYEEMIFGGEPDPRLSDDEPGGPGVREPRKPRRPEPSTGAASPPTEP